MAIPRRSPCLYCEEAGSGTPIVSVHEFGGDYLSWEPQMRFFSRRDLHHLCGARLSALGRAGRDRQIFSGTCRGRYHRGDDGSGCGGAHRRPLDGRVCVPARGDFPGRVISATAAGTGYGAEKVHEQYFKDISEQVARNFRERGSKAFGPMYAEGASRVQFQAKDPRGWKLFADRLAQHSKWVPPTPCLGCRFGVLRCTTSKRSWRQSMCRCS